VRSALGPRHGGERVVALADATATGRKSSTLQPETRFERKVSEAAAIGN
jgi:hypothetical protein